MDRGRYIIYTVLIALPVLAVLVLLAMFNVLYMLLGVIVILACLYILKRTRPETFAWMRRRKPAADAQAPRRSQTSEAASAAKVYMILAEQGAAEQRRITVDKPQFSIGRGEDNDFSLPDKRIGRRHLRIEYSPSEDVCYAVDLGSVNGSYLNSRRMDAGERYRLRQGDRIMINDRPFEVEYAHY